MGSWYLSNAARSFCSSGETAGVEAAGEADPCALAVDPAADDPTTPTSRKTTAPTLRFRAMPPKTYMCSPCCGMIGEARARRPGAGPRSTAGTAGGNLPCDAELPQERRH